LSVFAGGWTLEAAEAVCGDEWKNGRVEESRAPMASDPSALPVFHSSIPAAEVLDLLTALVDKSLVQVSEDAESEARYRLLETVRQYALQRLEETGDHTAVERRHRDWFLELALAAAPELKGPDQQLWMERLEAEHDNLRAALARCQEDPAGAEVGLR